MSCVAMRSLVRGFDRFLRWALGVYEFCDDPDCLLRVRLTAAAHAVALPDRDVPAGAPILELHLWNERIPPLPPAGPDLAWAVKTQRMLMASFRALAGQMRRDRRLAGVQAVGGATVLCFTGDDSGGVKLFERLGFTVCPYHSPLGRFGEFWENFYTWAIMWAFNEATLRRRRLLRLRRSEIWMTTAEFLRRYGENRRRRQSCPTN